MAKKYSQSRKVIWLIKDGKRGHENQSFGLINALAQIHELDCYEISVNAYHASWAQAIFGKLAITDKFPKPDLVIGCGSRTHSTLFSAGRTTDAPTILIMAPPRGLSRFFSFCIVPEHDKRSGRNVITTLGAMNQIQVGQCNNPQLGLILLGGPSKHHSWDTKGILSQINCILTKNPELKWTITTSRRTPKDLTKSLEKIVGPQLELIPSEKTSAEWLPAQLTKSTHLWVTEDSVSMIFEALSSGAKVGLLEVPRKKGKSRVLNGIDQLKEERLVMPFDQLKCDLNVFEARPALNEARRISRIVSQRLKWH